MAWFRKNEKSVARSKRFTTKSVSLNYQTLERVLVTQLILSSDWPGDLQGEPPSEVIFPCLALRSRNPMADP